LMTASELSKWEKDYALAEQVRDKQRQKRREAAHAASTAARAARKHKKRRCSKSCSHSRSKSKSRRLGVYTRSRSKRTLFNKLVRAHLVSRSKAPYRKRRPFSRNKRKVRR
jgi:hypothetical protein